MVLKHEILKEQRRRFNRFCYTDNSNVLCSSIATFISKSGSGNPINSIRTSIRSMARLRGDTPCCVHLYATIIRLVPVCHNFLCCDRFNLCDVRPSIKEE